MPARPRYFWLRSLGLPALLLAVMAGVGTVLPQQWRARQTVTMDVRESEAIRDYLGDLATWPQWTVWNSRDLAGFEWKPLKREGNRVTKASWKSNELGRVSVELVADPPAQNRAGKTVGYVMTFHDHNRAQVRGEFTLVRQTNSWQLVWRQHGPLGKGIPAKWTGLLVVRFLAQADMNAGLAALKEHLERTSD